MDEDAERGDEDAEPETDRMRVLLDEHVEADGIGGPDALETAPAEERKAALRELRGFAEEEPRAFDAALDALVPFLTDEERPVRLTTAKLFVAVAQARPDAVVPAVEALADRLADEAEFYYVRARSAEALGYVALEHPEEVASPETLADLRVGLSFDEPEVKEKLAKAIEYVALGNPDRLRHQVPRLAEHLDDGNELVRYHLTTALVAVGCEHPGKLADAETALADRLTDENAYVRGRAAEALGLLARSEATGEIPTVEDTERGDDEAAAAFVTARVRFARQAREGSADDATGDTADNAVGRATSDGTASKGRASDGVGTIASVRAETDGIVEEITSPDGGECPHCGLELPENGPPMCPRCGAPY